MTNLEKIERLQKLYKEAADMVQYCKMRIATNTHEWSTENTLAEFTKDAAALKYALKGIQLMQDLVNDASDEGGDYGF
jgi:hypothetical protein